MKHIDLFSGIGGFALAVDRVWPNSEHTFCDNDKFCQEVIKKHWPNSQIFSDIRELTPNTFFNEYRSKPSKIRETKEIQGVSRKTLDTRRTSRTDILTGGFPCQPFSQAGRRQGTADDRYLWPEMFRVIQFTKPTWVIAENVGGLVTWNEGMVLEKVCTDLESEGYEVQPFIIPAVAVNAPHRRDRVWIVAKNTKFQRTHRGMENNRQVLESQISETQNERSGWEKNWVEVATKLCRMDDGLPKRLDRNPRLKALGNAIVPQVAEEIMKAINVYGKR